MQPDALASAPAFPSLEPGLTLLVTDGRPAGPLHSLVVDHVLLDGASALWVDARGNATTGPLADVAPSPRVLDRVRIARAFTAFQHYGIVEDLPGRVTADTALLVLPAVDWFYAGDDLRRGEGEAMLRGVLATIRELARARDLPVLLTRHEATGVGACVADYVDDRLTCTRTRFGPRFSGTDVETLLYERPGGVQTTLAFWRRLLERRHPKHARSRPEVASVGAD